MVNESAVIFHGALFGRMLHGEHLGAPAFQGLESRDPVDFDYFKITKRIQAHVRPDMIQTVQRFHGLAAKVIGLLGHFGGGFDLGNAHPPHLAL